MKEKYNIGDITTVEWNPHEQCDIEPPQPVLIVRIATREEYRAYWKDKVKEYTEPSNFVNEYYEVLTD